MQSQSHQLLANLSNDYHHHHQSLISSNSQEQFQLMANRTTNCINSVSSSISKETTTAPHLNSIQHKRSRISPGDDDYEEEECEEEDEGEMNEDANSNVNKDTNQIAEQDQHQQRVEEQDEEPEEEEAEYDDDTSNDAVETTDSADENDHEVEKTNNSNETETKSNSSLAYTPISPVADLNSHHNQHHHQQQHHINQINSNGSNNTNYNPSSSTDLMKMMLMIRQQHQQNHLIPEDQQLLPSPLMRTCSNSSSTSTGSSCSSSSGVSSSSSSSISSNIKQSDSTYQQQHQQQHNSNSLPSATSSLCASTSNLSLMNETNLKAFMMSAVQAANSTTGSNSSIGIDSAAGQNGSSTNAALAAVAAFADQFAYMVRSRSSSLSDSSTSSSSSANMTNLLNMCKESLPLPSQQQHQQHDDNSATANLMKQMISSYQAAVNPNNNNQIAIHSDSSSKLIDSNNGSSSSSSSSSSTSSSQMMSPVSNRKSSSSSTISSCSSTSSQSSMGAVSVNDNKNSFNLQHQQPQTFNSVSNGFQPHKLAQQHQHQFNQINNSMTIDSTSAAAAAAAAVAAKNDEIKAKINAVANKSILLNGAASSSTPCKVCGDEASGFHYGVDSCEGCKGFFRRCITQGMNHQCTNNQQCEMTPFSRNSCQFCRLKKCFAVGMSREASRLGRRPKRAKDDKEINSNAGGGSGGSTTSTSTSSSSGSFSESLASNTNSNTNNNTATSMLLNSSATNSNFATTPTTTPLKHQTQHSSASKQIESTLNNASTVNICSFQDSARSNSTSSLLKLSTPLNLVSNESLLMDQDSKSPKHLQHKIKKEPKPPVNNNNSNSSSSSNNSLSLNIPPMNNAPFKLDHPSANSFDSPIDSNKNNNTIDSNDSHFPTAIPAPVPNISSQTLSSQTQSTHQPTEYLNKKLNYKVRNEEQQHQLQQQQQQQQHQHPSSISSAQQQKETSQKQMQQIEMLTKLISISDRHTSIERTNEIEFIRTSIIESHCQIWPTTFEKIRRRYLERPPIRAPRYGDLSRPNDIAWDNFIEAMVPLIMDVVKYCKYIPGFNQILQHDQVQLLKQGSFEVICVNSFMLVDAQNKLMLTPDMEYLMDSSSIKSMPLGFFMNEVFELGIQVSPMKLTDSEIALFNAVLVMNPDRGDLQDKDHVEELQSTLLHVLYKHLKYYRSDEPDLFFKLLKLIPVIQEINRKHSEALNTVKMSQSQSQTNNNSTVSNNNNSSLTTPQYYKQPVNGNPVIGQHLAATTTLSSSSSSSSSASSSPIKTELNQKKPSNYMEQMSI